MNVRLLFLWCVALLVHPLGSVPATADEKPAKHKQADEEPATPEQAANAWLEAVKADNGEAVKVLAGKVDPDPWIVADVLCARGEFDAAAAFAKAAPPAEAKELPAYVSMQRSRDPKSAQRDKVERDLVGAMSAAWSSGNEKEVVERTATLASSFDSVARLRLCRLRVAALYSLRRVKEAGALARAGAASADALGWLRHAGELHRSAGICAYHRSAWARAQEDLKAQLAICERRGDAVAISDVIARIGHTQVHRGEFAKALSNFRRALAAKEKRGDRHAAARLLMNIGNVHHGQGNYVKARSIYERAMAAQEALGDRLGAAGTLGNIGAVIRLQGDYITSLRVLERALAVHEELKNADGVVRMLDSMSRTYMLLGDFDKALSNLNDVMAMHEASGKTGAVASALHLLGSVQLRRGEHVKALSALERSLSMGKALGWNSASTIAEMGTVYAIRGDFARALSTLHRALALHEAGGAKHEIAKTLTNIGFSYQSLGLYDKALAVLKRAEGLMEEIGDKSNAAVTLVNIGAAYMALEDHAAALSVHERALATHDALGNKAAAVDALSRIGFAYQALGDYDKALSIQERALSAAEAFKDESIVALVLAHLGSTHQALGDYARARDCLERSARAARHLRIRATLLTALKGLALLHLDADKPSQALCAAKEALPEIEAMLGSLGDEEGAFAREQYAGIYAAGTLAAVREGDLGEALTFLESGRAGALLDALGRRDKLRWKADSLPPHLRRQELEARVREGIARRAYDRAATGGDRKARRAASRALDEASDAVREVADRIRSEFKQQAGLHYPSAETIEVIESALLADQALVIFGLCRDEALALVLRQDGERIVSLGKSSDVIASCEALSAPDRSSDPTPALDRLRRILVDPLKLEREIQQVLISPEGPLCYVPFGALFDQVVTMTPSGTTHVLLLEEERSKGQGVLALGDPEYDRASEGAAAVLYRGRTLPRLPGTRREVEAIGTTKLLGASASEEGLARALPTTKRWRAVHLACHGVVNVDKPMLSFLALSPEGSSDGFLTALEVLRMAIPADVAVLSACETGRGKIVKGEGIVGLTRAFMFAGASRVICSLWKVDDDATQALMTKFYELWNPKQGAGIRASDALQQAQAFIRNHAEHPEWKHPVYWAAWMLWGLP